VFLSNRKFYVALLSSISTLIAVLSFNGVADAGTVYGYVDCKDCSSEIELTFKEDKNGGGDVKTVYADTNKNYRTYLKKGKYIVIIKSNEKTWTYSIRSFSRARRQDINLP
jgi:hypothetical protein